MVAVEDLKKRVVHVVTGNSVGSWANPNSVRPGTWPIGRYTGRVSGWERYHPLRIGLSPVGLRWRQNPTRVKPLKVGRVVGSPE